jgi:hypothetical protein
VRWAWVVVGGVLVAGALWQIAAPNGDLFQYRCFALAFWRGSAVTHPLAACAGRLPTGSFPPFRVLPLEYPPLALIPFSLPLLLGGAWGMTAYVLAFNALMLGSLVATARVVRQMRPGRAEWWLVVWLGLGATTIALVRYDAVPVLLVVLALWLAQRGPSRGAYVLLAVGTLLKLYPALILVALAAWDWQRLHATPQKWWWARNLALAGGVGLGLQGVADLVSHRGGIPWLSVQGGRPPQIESSAAALVWLKAVFTGQGGTIFPASVQRSLAFLDPAGRPLATLTMLVGVVGIGWGLWALCQGTIPFWQACAGMLLALLAGAAIFSPQYILWATPLVALVLGTQPHRGHWPVTRAARQLALVWTAVCLCTTISYSVGYLVGWPAHPGGSLAIFMLFVIVRDALVWYAAWLLLWPGHFAPVEQGVTATLNEM